MLLKSTNQPRELYIDRNMKYNNIPSREVELYPAVFSDNTQVFTKANTKATKDQNLSEQWLILFV